MVEKRGRSGFFTVVPGLKRNLETGKARDFTGLIKVVREIFLGRASLAERDDV
jgi:hypothetical protein